MSRNAVPGGPIRDALPCRTPSVPCSSSGASAPRIAGVSDAPRPVATQEVILRREASQSASLRVAFDASANFSAGEWKLSGFSHALSTTTATRRSVCNSLRLIPSSNRFAFGATHVVDRVHASGHPQIVDDLFPLPIDLWLDDVSNAVVP